MPDQINAKAEMEAISATLRGDARKVLSYCQPDDFFAPVRQNIMRAARDLIVWGSDPTISAIADALRQRGLFDDDALHWMEHAVNEIDYTDAEASARLVSELASRRGMAALYRELAVKLETGEIPSHIGASRAINGTMGIAKPFGEPSSHISQVADEAAAEFQLLRNGQIVGYKTFFPSVDNLLVGMLPTEYVGLSGTTGSGKSLAALRICLKNAQAGVGAAIYTLEMSKKQVFNRAVAMESKTLKNAKQLRGCLEPGISPLTTEQEDEIEYVRQQLSQVPLYIAERKFDLWSIISDMRRLVLEDVKIFVIDYAHKVTCGDFERTIALGRISAALRDFALEHGVVVIPILKMNRVGAAGIRKGEDNLLEGIDGSSAFEYDCSIVLNFHLQKPELICDCPPEVLADYKTTHGGKPKHQTDENVTCFDCSGHIRKSPLRFGRIAIPKARDGDLDDSVRIFLDGPKLKMEELYGH